MQERGASKQEQKQEQDARRVNLGWVEGEEIIGDEQAPFSD